MLERWRRWRYKRTHAPYDWAEHAQYGGAYVRVISRYPRVSV